MTNALREAASPYLRQHAENPVAWVPWGPEAFDMARARDVPLLLSIGYATCHWCHVMAHESFDDAGIAAEMNAAFVCVKVDREEHPEVDAIYMDALQALTGRGGWPLHAFLDHDGRPFFAGTYFSPAAWRDLLGQLSSLWREDRPRIHAAAAELTAHLLAAPAPSPADLPRDLDQRVVQRTAQRFDEAHPGLGRAPKFPPSQLLALLLDLGQAHPLAHALAGSTLEAMQDSGLHDRVGGGFHRYSTDRQWRVPHFEKMLYDNAQLAVAFARAGAALGRPDFLRTACHIGDYLLRDMRVSAPDGAFLGYASAEDADDQGPEGSEGGYYALSPTTLSAILGPDIARPLTAAWDLAEGTARVGPSGHPEPIASHIPHPRGAPLTAIAAAEGLPDVEALRLSWEPWLPTLRGARDPARRPIRDDKVVTDLNGLALSALATLGRLAPNEAQRVRFTAATDELVRVLHAQRTDAGLLRLSGQTPREAFVTDYGLYALGLLEAWRLLGAPILISRAIALIDEAEAKLIDPQGGFFATPAGRTDLIRRTREGADGPYPSGQHALALACARLHGLSGLSRFRALAEGVFAAQSRLLTETPEACPTLMTAWHELREGYTTVLVTSEPSTPRAAALLDVARRAPSPRVLPVPATTHRGFGWPALAGADPTEPVALVCQGRTCLAPITEPSALAEVLGSL